MARHQRDSVEGLEGNVSNLRVPTQIDLMWPTLRVLARTGGSASVQEISKEIAEIMELPDEILEERHSDRQSELDFRAGWARTRLKQIGAIDNSQRGIWSITDRGRGLVSDQQVREQDAREQGNRATLRPGRAQDSMDLSDQFDDQTANERSWEDTLLAILKRMEPEAFERLCQRLLRECGFTQVEVTGRTGDGGIDGVGVLRINLLSFHVLYQCKRYEGAVGAGAIRDSRGAMVGRTDKGLFLTTGHFTKDAEHEAVRDGAPAIDLIDGMELCNLLKSVELGVKTRRIEKEEIVVEESFFESM